MRLAWGFVALCFLQLWTAADADAAYQWATPAGRQLKDKPETSCTTPPVGMWSVQHYNVTDEEPIPNSSQEPIGESSLNITMVFDGGYQGNGAGVYYRRGQRSGNPSEREYQIIASFNTDHCTFSGSLFNLQTTPMVTAGLQWEYDGDELKGNVAFFDQDGERNAYVLGEYEYFVLTPST